MVDATKLPIETGVDAIRLADAMFGSIKIVEATYRGDPASAGIYMDGLKIAPRMCAWGTLC